MDKILIEDGNDKKKFIVRLNEFEGTPLLDLRYWYKDKASKEFKPTKQGISITSSNYLSFKSVVSRFDEEVISHLNKKNKKNVDNAKERNELSKVILETPEVDTLEYVFESYLPKNDFFKVNYSGGRATIIFNELHPFSDGLKTFDSDSLNPILRILISIDLSFQSSSNYNEASGGAAIEFLKYEISKNLKKYKK